MYTIYQIENLLNGNLYIGSAKNFEARKKRHIHLLNKNKHHSRYLQNAWNKYGAENFSFSILKQVSADEVFQEENNLIREKNPSYNVMKDVFSHIGIKRSKETCEKIAKANTGKVVSDITKDKLRQHNLGKKQSLKTIKRKIDALSIPVIAYYKKTGLFYKEFSSATVAAIELNCKRGCIYDAVHNRKKSYKGYIWKQKIKAGEL